MEILNEAARRPTHGHAGSCSLASATTVTRCMELGLARLGPVLAAARSSKAAAAAARSPSCETHRRFMIAGKTAEMILEKHRSTMDVLTPSPPVPPHPALPNEAKCPRHLTIVGFSALGEG